MSQAATVPSTRFALQVAVGLVSLGILAWSLVGARTALEGLPLVLCGFGGLVFVALTTAPHLAKLLFGNLAVILFLVIGMSDLCASRCGQVPFYDHVLGLPTALVGIGLHLAMLVLGLASLRVQIPRWIYCSAMSCALGGSLFYGTLMAATGHWCAACAASHAVVLFMAIEVFRLLDLRREGSLRSRFERTAYGMGAVIVALGINLLYHHRAYQGVRNDPAELLAWLASQERSAHMPVGFIQSSANLRRQVDDTDGKAVVEDIVRGREGAAVAEATRGVSSSPQAATPEAVAVQAQVEAGQRSERGPLGVWGDVRAPVKLVANLDPMCPFCARGFEAVLAIRDLVDGPKAVCSVDFALTYKVVGDRPEFAGKLACYLIYAASGQSEAAMLGVMRSLFSEPGRVALRVAAEAVERYEGAVAAASARLGGGGDAAAQRAAKARASAQVAQEHPELVRAMKDGLVGLYELLPTAVDKARLRQDLEQRRGDMEQRLQATFSRMAEFGVRDAPNFWAYRTRSASTEPFALYRGARDEQVLRFTVSQGQQERASQ